MGAVDFVVVPIDSTHVTFDDLRRLGRSSQEVVCRLLRFWDSRNINRDNQFMGITLLFLDEKGIGPYVTGGDLGFLYIGPEKSFLVVFNRLRLPE